MSDVILRGLLRTPENGGRRSRTLMLDDGTAQVQCKEARLPGGEGRYLQLRYWTQEGDWNHLVIDPSRAGVAAIVSVGYGETEVESWEMARLAALETAGVEL
jgi:hypothetical protein